MLELQLIERGGENRQLIFTGSNGNGIDFEPLRLDALKRFRKTGDLSVTLRNATVREVTPSGPEISTVNGPIRWKNIPQDFRIVGLVEDGCLPVELVQTSLLLPDRNVLSRMPRLYKAIDYSHLLGRGTLNVSPMLAAFEGKNRRIPTSQEFKESYRFETSKLQANAPWVTTPQLSDGELLDTYEMLEDFREHHGFKVQFLSKVLPWLTKLIRHDALEATDLVFQELAHEYRVEQNSILFLLALDCLYDGGPARDDRQLPGRRVFKPSLTPSDGALHNALADVFLLEALMKLAALAPGSAVAGCTDDNGVAQAWAMFHPRLKRVTERSASFALALDELGPKMPSARRAALYLD